MHDVDCLANINQSLAVPDRCERLEFEQYGSALSLDGLTAFASGLVSMPQPVFGGFVPDAETLCPRDCPGTMPFYSVLLLPAVNVRENEMDMLTDALQRALQVMPQLCTWPRLSVYRGGGGMHTGNFVYYCLCLSQLFRVTESLSASLFVHGDVLSNARGVSARRPSTGGWTDVCHGSCFAPCALPMTPRWRTASA